MLRSFTTLVLVASTVGCQGAGLGRVPEAFVELYDDAAPEGMIEVEIGRDGVVREIEADIPIESLPDFVREAALQQLPDATITGAEREIQLVGRVWEVKLDYQGVGWELLIDPDGNVIETEKEIAVDAAPPAVIATANETVPGPAKSVEVITRGDDVEYHIKKDRDGATIKLVLSSDGTLRRAVREARAEIEIPLAR